MGFYIILCVIGIDFGLVLDEARVICKRCHRIDWRLHQLLPVLPLAEIRQHRQIGLQTVWLPVIAKDCRRLHELGQQPGRGVGKMSPPFQLEALGPRKRTHQAVDNPGRLLDHLPAQLDQMVGGNIAMLAVVRRLEASIIRDHRHNRAVR